MVEKKIHRQMLLLVSILLLPGLLWVTSCWSKDKESVIERPKVFDSRGIINRIGSKELVISDILYQYGSDTIFYSTKNRKSDPVYFSKGMEVGVMYKRGPMKVITEVWKIKTGK